MSIKIDIKGADIVLKNIDKLSIKTKEGVKDAIRTFVLGVHEQAAQNVPNHESGLAQSLKPKLDKLNNLEASVIANIEYAAFVEFGTRKYAAKYVATLPADWQAYARKFRGKGTGSFDDFVLKLMRWIRLKGLSGKVKGQTKKQTLEADAYALAIHIIRNGIKPHPFLYPAFTNKQKIGRLEDDLKKIFK